MFFLFLVLRKNKGTDPIRICRTTSGFMVLLLIELWVSVKKVGSDCFECVWFMDSKASKSSPTSAVCGREGKESKRRMLLCASVVLLLDCP